MVLVVLVWVMSPKSQLVVSLVTVLVVVLLVPSLKSTTIVVALAKASRVLLVLLRERLLPSSSRLCSTMPSKWANFCGPVAKALALQKFWMLLTVRLVAAITVALKFRIFWVPSATWLYSVMLFTPEELLSASICRKPSHSLRVAWFFAPT